MREQSIQSAIMKRLQKAGWIVVRVVISNLAGFPDLMALKKGRTVFIEVKRPGKKPTELQAHRHIQLREHNFEVMVIDHIDQIKTLET